MSERTTDEQIAELAGRLSRLDDHAAIATVVDTIIAERARGDAAQKQLQLCNLDQLMTERELNEMQGRVAVLEGVVADVRKLADAAHERADSSGVSPYRIFRILDQAERGSDV